MPMTKGTRGPVKAFLRPSSPSVAAKTASARRHVHITSPAKASRTCNRDQRTVTRDVAKYGNPSNGGVRPTASPIAASTKYWENVEPVSFSKASLVVSDLFSVDTAIKQLSGAIYTKAVSTVKMDVSSEAVS